MLADAFRRCRRRTWTSNTAILLESVLAGFLILLGLMRRARRDSIGVTGIVHKMWRGHNREHVLETDVEKAAYLRHLGDTFTDEIKKQVQWYSYCLMGNHTHEGNRILGVNSKFGLKTGIQALGNWMRNGHSRFGAEYNRRHERQGKVAYDRPKTIEVKNEESVLRVMFYGDANPVRAGLVSHPSRYRHSSYRFYAYGEASEHTVHMTPPPAYLALGDTPEKRQKQYRSLCDRYLRVEGLIDDTPPEHQSGGIAIKGTNSQNEEIPQRARGDPKPK
ncbi:MAG: hypothetical protein GY847_27630 [Proteobacteria bacterium]|nr:hypothetical protein [Pseudomonadota bacterium]